MAVVPAVSPQSAVREADSAFGFGRHVLVDAMLEVAEERAKY